jgi:hypothetical protein
MPSFRAARGFAAFTIAVLAAHFAIGAPAEAKKRKAPVPSTKVIKKLMIEQWDTGFEKATGGTVELSFKKIRRARPRRSGPENLLIPHGSKIYPVRITMVQTLTYSTTDVADELESPFIGGGSAPMKRVDVTEIVQEALFYKGDFGWRFSQRGAETKLISST